MASQNYVIPFSHTLPDLLQDVGSELEWPNLGNHNITVAVEPRLHEFLRLLNPALIGPEPEPYNIRVILKVLRRYLLSNQDQTLDPNNCYIYQFGNSQLQDIFNRRKCHRANFLQLVLPHLALIKAEVTTIDQHALYGPYW